MSLTASARFWRAAFAAASVSMLFFITACDIFTTSSKVPAAPSIEESTVTDPIVAETPTTVAETTTTVAESTTTTTEPAATATEPTTTPTNSAPAPEPAPVDDLGSSGASETEQKVVELTNAERVKNGCSAVTANAELNKTAKGHSVDMVDNNYFDHDGLNGSSPGDRIKAQGYSYSTYGENIAKGHPTPEAVVKGWMDSPGHRANILNCKFAEIGVGHHETTWTQVFGTPS